MGTWSIILEGHGPNQNNQPADADQLGRLFVSMLEQAGHSEVKGVFIYGPKLASMTNVKALVAPDRDAPVPPTV